MTVWLQRQNKVVVGIILALLLIVLAGGVWKYRSRIRTFYNIGRALVASRTMVNDGAFTNILFIHQSTGRGLIADGEMRRLFSEAGYSLWDHDYNYIGLTRPDGTPSGYSYNIPGDNTNPDGYADLFSQPLHASPTNALSAIMQHEVIIFKSCYPVSDIGSPEQLKAYKQYLLSVRDVADRHPDRLFIALSPPSLVPESTRSENAARAREFSTWLQSDEFLSGHSNFYSFGFFDLLADDDPDSPDYNMLKSEYRRGTAGDSHPNELANRIIGPQLVDFVIHAIETYQVTP